MGVPPPAPDAPRGLIRRPIVAIVSIVATLALLFGPGLVEHARFAADPWHFNDDVRQQIWPLLRDADPSLFPDDYIADYYLANLPRGYLLFYGLGANAVDPRTLSRIVPYGELLVVLYCLIAASWRLAGPAAAWGTGVLCLSADIYLARMAGGVPRSFAFPLVAMGVLALVRGKPLRLCFLAALGAAFYYPIALLLGCGAAVYLLGIPPSWQGEAGAWSWKRRVATLSATAAAAAVLVLPALVAGRAYGPLIDRSRWADYPEAGPGGRLGEDDLPADGRLMETAAWYAGYPLASFAAPWAPELRERLHRSRRVRNSLLALGGAVFCASMTVLLAASVPARRLLVLLGSAFALYAVSLPLWPRLYVPGRYLGYLLPLLSPVLLPAAISLVAGRWRRTRPPPAAAVVVLGAVVLGASSFGLHAPGRVGLGIDVPPRQRPLYELIARLPNDAMIAGWPGDVVDDIPYVSARKILIGYETHQVFHRDYVDEMRRRMRALIDAYFANDPAPLGRLKSELGATHLLVDRDHYGSERPRSFVPFDAMVEAAAIRLRRPEALRQANAAAVYDDGRLVLLDLGRLVDRREPEDSAP